jgi:dihydroxyacetone kinase-like protein
VSGSAPDLRAVIAAVATAVDAAAPALNALDAAVGDGDHGTTVSRGFRRAADAVAAASDDAPGPLLQAAARALLSMGGASGPLFGTMFLEAAKVAGARATPAGATPGGAPLEGTDVAEMLGAAAAGVKARGRVEAGQKTLYDALAPAAEAARRAVAAGEGAAAVIAAAAAAARRGAEATAPMIGRKGRAGFVGERSVGHADAGARTVAVILKAIAQHCRK